MMPVLEAREQTLGKIFSDDYQFDIPEYQRPYSWTEEQTSALVEDVLAAVDRNDPAYFLGSIVLIKEPKGPDAEVVDGQQRLTTLTILLCVLRNLSPSDDWKKALEGRIQAKGDVIRQVADRPRLSVRLEDRDFFQQTFLNRDGVHRHFEGNALIERRQRMRDNAVCLYETLRNKDENARRDLVRYLDDRCYLAVVSASDRNSAYRIFSVMNDRGLDLSPTDILKAEIIGDLPQEHRSRYTQQWENTEDELERDGFRDLFAHIRMIYMRTKQHNTLNAEFVESVLSTTTSVGFMKDILKPYANTYGDIVGSEYSATQNAEGVNGYLRHLSVLDNNDWIPPAMLFLQRNGDDSQEVLNFIRDLERLAYGLFLRRDNINTRINRYRELIAQIEEGSDLWGDGSPLQLTREERQDIKHRLDGDIYSLTYVRKPLLLRLNAMNSTGVVQYQHRIITVEHVLPQNPADGSEWLNLFPDEQKRLSWCHRVANLVLLSRRKNSQASNYDFDTKKQKYFQTGPVDLFSLTVQVLAESEWTEGVLQKRQDELLKRMCKEWRLE